MQLPLFHCLQVGIFGRTVPNIWHYILEGEARYLNLWQNVHISITLFNFVTEIDQSKRNNVE